MDIPLVLERRLGDLEKKIEKMYVALVGSDLTEDGGMVSRLEDVEKEVSDIRDRLTNLNEEWKKYKWAVNRIFIGLPLLISAILWVFKQAGIVK
jgi:hypothetical protein